jgi:Xaa-Pro aminopeptidase
MGRTLESVYDSPTFRGVLGLRRPARLMVDEEMRDFIQRGLGSAGFEVMGLQGKVEEVRQIKTAREVDILRAVNTGTVEAVRQMRKCLYPGLTENEIASALDNALRAAGLDPFFDIVLFDENASNPHGGTNGSKVLEPETFCVDRRRVRVSRALP